MDNPQNNTSHTPRKILRPRRLVLLASVASLSIAVLGLGPLDHALGRSWMTAAQATEAAPAGFADLVSKVKPAVISVRVKIDDDGTNGQVTERRGDNERIGPGRLNSSSASSVFAVAERYAAAAASHDYG